MADLHGRVIAFLEARRAVEMASLITRHGGQPCSVPCLREIHRPDTPELASAVAHLCDDTVGIAVFLTGVGANTIFEAAAIVGREGDLLTALERKRVATRGPKPTMALRKRGVRVDLTTGEPHTTHELLAALDAWDVRQVTIALQIYGGQAPEMREALEARGARVIEMHPYTWDEPEDLTPVLRLLDDAEADNVAVIAATSAAQVENLFHIAQTHGKEAALQRVLSQVPVAAQGPICAAAFTRRNVPVAITAERGSMGGLVLAIARHFDAATEQEPAVAHATVG